MSASRTAVAGALAALALVTLTSCAPDATEPVAAPSSTPDVWTAEDVEPIASTPGRRVFVDVDGNRLVIRGARCLRAEDSTELRLVEYAPSRSTVVYRCVTP